MKNGFRYVFVFLLGVGLLAVVGLLSGVAGGGDEFEFFGVGLDGPVSSEPEGPERPSVPSVRVPKVAESLEWKAPEGSARYRWATESMSEHAEITRLELWCALAGFDRSPDGIRFIAPETGRHVLTVVSADLRVAEGLVAEVHVIPPDDGLLPEDSRILRIVRTLVNLRLDGLEEAVLPVKLRVFCEGELLLESSERLEPGEDVWTTLGET